MRFAVLLSLVCYLLAGAPASAEPSLADSAWPIYHANTGATASSPYLGPGPVREASSVPALTSKRLRKPSVSPWTVMATPYMDGSQAIMTTPNDGIAKYLLRNGELEQISFLKLSRRFFDFDWGILLLDDGRGISTEQREDRFVIFADRTPPPEAELIITGYISVDRELYGQLTAHFTLAPDGRLITLTSANKLLAVDIEERTVVATYDLPNDSGTSFHNSFPIDEAGRIYLSTQTLMAAIDWDGDTFSLAWKASYDMRGPGCESDVLLKPRQEFMAVARGKPCTGSGTTPTLLGEQNTGVVIIVDGHSPRNHLVAFWRDKPPVDWLPVQHASDPSLLLDEHVAATFALPLSTPESKGFTAENSPAALGDAVIVAQWAGFKPGREPPRGLQRVDWLPDKRRFSLVWANPDVHFNGVPTIACQSRIDCHAYGMGRYGREYRYTSVDFETGAVSGVVTLGNRDDVLDQGNNHAIAADGSIVYSGRFRMVNVR